MLTILDAVRALLSDTGSFLTLVKPQFEADRAQVGEGGIVRDPVVWLECLERVADAFGEVGLAPQAACASPITGHKGNHEFLLLGAVGTEPRPIDFDAVIGSVAS